MVLSFKGSAKRGSNVFDVLAGGKLESHTVGVGVAAPQ